MKKIVSLFSALGLMFGVVGFASADAGGDPNGNGCGLGAPGVVQNGTQQGSKTPPPFVEAEIDGDDKVEGRKDSRDMRTHNRCVSQKKG